MSEKALQALALCLVAVSTGTGQIVGPTEKSFLVGDTNVSLEFTVVADSAKYKAFGGIDFIREPGTLSTLVVRVLCTKAGEGFISIFATKDGETLPIHVCKVTVVDPGPKPPGPSPPDPKPPGPIPPPPIPPEPKPPDPKPPEPAPTPAPIPVAGLRVLIVYESADVGKLSAGQRAIIFGKSVRDALDAKCVIGPDGKTREWRIFDKDVDATADSKLWADAMKRNRTAYPWLIISNGTTGWEGPLPATAGEFMNLVERYEK